MDIKKLGQKIKLGYSGEVVEGSATNKRSELWFSPAHWKAMAAEKQAVVVDIWHRDHGYSCRFPFGNMATPAKNEDGKLTLSSYDVGITFSIGPDIRQQAILETVKELKIPHLLADYEKVRTKREAVVSRSK